MGRRTVAAAMAVVMIGAVLAGCERDSESGASPTVAVSSDTRPSATPTPTLTPSPIPSEDALFLEAKEVHLKYVEQTFRMDRQGGAATLPESMGAVVGGEFAKELERLYADMYQRGIYATSDSSWKRASAWPIPAVDGAEVGLGSCVDFRGVIYARQSDSATSRGTWLRDEVQFKRRDGKLVIVDGSSERVKTCSE